MNPEITSSSLSSLDNLHTNDNSIVHMILNGTTKDTGDNRGLDLSLTLQTKILIGTILLFLLIVVLFLALYVFPRIRIRNRNRIDYVNISPTW